MDAGAANDNVKSLFQRVKHWQTEKKNRRNDDIIHRKNVMGTTIRSYVDNYIVMIMVGWVGWDCWPRA